MLWLSMEDIFDTKKYLDESFVQNEFKHTLKELKIDVIIKDEAIKAKVRRYMYSVKSFFMGLMP